MVKPKLFLVFNYAWHFVGWEIPYFAYHFELTTSPAEDTILFAFGPDVVERAATLPALRRVALLFPGFGFNPYHILEQHAKFVELINNYYDLVFVNPGLVHEAFKSLPKVTTCPFSIDANLITYRSFRTAVNSLLHASADYPQKDRARSEAIMKITGLQYEVYPPSQPIQENWLSLSQQMSQAYFKKLWWKSGIPKRMGISQQQLPKKYKPHKALIKKYQDYDGFVHVAAPKPPNLDGKYTATLLEAGLTGAILFWHDTYHLGNDFSTIFSIPLEPVDAAAAILSIRKSIDVEKHSTQTREEILDRCHPSYVVKLRYEAIKAII